jgi:nitrogen fixation protein FixH
MSIPQRNLYRPLILLLIISFLGFSLWSARQAVNPGSQVTDRDYYSKGLKYTSTLLEKRAAEGLGWQLSTEIAGQTLIFHIENAANQNVSQARGTLHLYLPGYPDGRPFELLETSSGDYRLELPPDLKGLLRARVMFERDGARLSRQLQLNL